MKTKKVIFIQGIHNFKLINKKVINSIKEEGYDVIHFPLFYTLKQNSKQKELIKKINNYLKDSQAEHILIGHSFGGIIAYSLKEESYSKVSKIVTIASPHKVTFKWFQEIISKLPYKKDIIVDEQSSYGLLFDARVPFIYTKYGNSQKHKNYVGTHNHVLTNQKFIKKVL